MIWYLCYWSKMLSNLHHAKSSSDNEQMAKKFFSSAIQSADFLVRNHHHTPSPLDLSISYIIKSCLTRANISTSKSRNFLSGLKWMLLSSFSAYLEFNHLLVFASFSDKKYGLKMATLLYPPGVAENQDSKPKATNHSLTLFLNCLACTAISFCSSSVAIVYASSATIHVFFFSVFASQLHPTFFLFCIFEQKFP